LMVSVTLEDLKAGVGYGLLDGYWTISVAQIRRLACDARIVPVVLGAQGETLDVGRATRIVPRSIRRALTRRDKGCAFPGCGKKAKWTDAHHILEWSRGGTTALANLTLLCRRHHRTIHHTDWQIRMIHGKPWFIPPSYVDPERTPRHNALHAMRS
ncbi:HNH endonuclease signature motif containing protein, partial [Amycolatopsis alkalitolerans]